MSSAVDIRAFCIAHYVTPARASGQRELTIRAGDVHNAMGYSNRVPAVCGAIRTTIFADEARVKLIAEDGPNQSTTTAFRFAVLP